MINIADHTIDDSQKEELIRYYMQKGKFIENSDSKKSVTLQLLKTYARTHKEQIKSIIIECSSIPISSKKLIEIASKPTLIELLIEELETKNIELKYIFEENLKSYLVNPTKKEIQFYDILINGIISIIIIFIITITIIIIIIILIIIIIIIINTLRVLLLHLLLLLLNNLLL